jgi:hypothetical protein
MVNTNLAVSMDATVADWPLLKNVEPLDALAMNTTIAFRSHSTAVTILKLAIVSSTFTNF